jgi:chromosome segregation ATPase
MAAAAGTADLDLNDAVNRLTAELEGAERSAAHEAARAEKAERKLAQVVRERDKLQRRNDELEADIHFAWVRIEELGGLVGASSDRALAA